MVKNTQTFEKVQQKVRNLSQKERNQCKKEIDF